MDDTWVLVVAACLAVYWLIDSCLARRDLVTDVWRGVVEEVERRRLVQPEHGTVYYVYVVHYVRDDGTRDIFKVAEGDDEPDAIALRDAKPGARLIKRRGTEYPVVR